MNTGEIFGYIASVLVFATFYMRTMLPLRIVAVASNLAFITYAAIDGLTPILILHSALLPLNLLRLMQIRELGAQVERASSHEFSAAAILPFMRKRVVRANEVLFSAGDLAEELFYVLEGEVFLPEVQQSVFLAWLELDRCQTRLVEQAPERVARRRERVSDAG